METGLFIDADNFDVPETVLQELEAVRAKLENLIQSDLMHKKQQKLFGVAETRDKALEATQEAFDRVRTLWTMVERWDEDYNSWIRDDFLTQNANSIDRDVKLYVRGASNLKKKMKNPVIARLWDLTNEMNSRMPLICELGDAALQHAHWERIFFKLGESCPLDLNFTLDQLFRAGLLRHANFARGVCRDAKEAAAKKEVAAALEEIIERLEGGASDSDSDNSGESGDSDDDDDDEDYSDEEDDEEEDDDDDDRDGDDDAPRRRSTRRAGRKHGTAAMRSTRASGSRSHGTARSK
jgi:hypothetical protein